jgi:molybdopterin-guanine dinucleotide biosynthesis adapter protein
VIPILSVVGRSNSGKTTLLEKLIRELARRGRRVGTIKHHFHGPVTVDVPGKDSWRHREAGARAVALVSSETFFVVRDTPRGLSPEAIAHLALFGMDLVLTEGFKSGALPKIEVNRQAQQSPLLCGPADRLVAVVADWDTGAPVRHFGLDGIAPLADFIEREYLEPGAGPAPELLVDGRRVALTAEAAQGLARAVHDLVGDSQDVPDGPTIELRIPGRSGHLARP